MAGSTFYNLLLTVLWAGLVASTAFDWGDYAALECPQPWQLFLLVDYILVLFMCFLDLVGSYYGNRDGDTAEKAIWIASRLAVVNYALIVLWVVVGTWFLVEDWECLDHVLDPEAWLSISIRVSGLIWIILRWLVTCCLLTAVCLMWSSYQRTQGRYRPQGFALVSMHRGNFRALRDADDDDNVASAA